MQLEPASYRRLETAFRQGDHDIVFAEGDAVAAELRADPDKGEALAELALMIGAAHAAHDRPVPAMRYLEYGLAMLPLATSAREVGRGDWFDLVLIALYIQSGRYEEAWYRATPLIEPNHTPETRFGAVRAQASLATVHGDYETAHHLLNTSAGIATRLRSRFRSALVEADRAVLLATQGQIYEAVNGADRVFGSLVRPAGGEFQTWANETAAAVALTLSRLSANTGDQLTAQRLLIQGTVAAEHARTAFIAGHLSLAQGVFWSAEHETARAEPALVDAARRFDDLGCLPSSALTTLEQGRNAQARGLHHSARPLYERALTLFRSLGQPREVYEVRRLLAGLDGPVSATGA